MLTETIRILSNVDSAKLARLAYEAADEKHTVDEATNRIADRLDLEGIDFEVVRNGSEACLLLSDFDDFIISVAGTNDKDDWKGNANALSRRLGSWPGKVHAGFDAGADAILVSIVDKLAAIDNRVVTLIGHSRGGAIVTLLAIKLRDRGINVSKIFTFGSPRALDREAAPFYDFNCIRFANQGDSVPHTPTVRKFIHIGRQQYLKPDGTISSFSLWDLVVQGFKVVFEFVRKRSADYTTEAHNMKTYIKRLKLAEKKYS